uniref:FCD domain-containing protein n=1 Tax=Neorhizobium sp. EC2-8 TaxID=3129230 RepID=UPI003100FD95
MPRALWFWNAIGEVSSRIFRSTTPSRSFGCAPFSKATQPVAPPPASPKPICNGYTSWNGLWRHSSRSLGWNEHLEGFDKLNAEFHAVIAGAAESPRLEKILASSLELPAAIFNRYSEPVEVRTRRTHAQHREILAALRARNPEWAQAAMNAHLFSLLPTASGSLQHEDRG